jgi:hypothetical protein
MRILITTERGVQTIAGEFGEHVLRPPAASGLTAVAAGVPPRRACHRGGETPAMQRGEIYVTRYPYLGQLKFIMINDPLI